MKTNKLLFLALILFSTLGFVACNLVENDFKSLKVTQRTQDFEFVLNKVEKGAKVEVESIHVQFDYDSVAALEYNLEALEFEGVQEITVGLDKGQGFDMSFIRGLKIFVSADEQRTDEVLIALSIEASKNEISYLAYKAAEKLKNCEMHSTVILSEVDVNTIKKLKMHLTQNPQYQTKTLYHKK